MSGENGALLRVEDLSKHFPIWKRGIFGRKITGHVRAVDGVSFDIARGEVLGLVGESGCGKTTTGRVILRADTPTGGEIHFTHSELGEMDLAQLSRDELQPVWQNIQLIFQDPYSSLNPRMTLEQIVSEPLRNYNVLEAAPCATGWRNCCASSVCARRSCRAIPTPSAAASASASASRAPSP